MGDDADRGEVLWTPSPDAWETTQIGRFGSVNGHADWDSLHRWSITDLDGFWRAVAEWFDVPWHTPPQDGVALAKRAMPGSVWFPGATLNFAEVALRQASATPDAVAVIARSQSRDEVVLTWAELARQVACCQQAMRNLGVGRGDRVVAYAPNTAATLVAMLATASIGAVWASCPPEFGTRAVIDRFAQLEPALLFAVDGYAYGSKQLDRVAEVDTIINSLPTLQHVIRMQHLGTGPNEFDATLDAAAATAPATPGFESVAFDHPLYVLFSSGTTGLPKAIVHGHGGVTLEHLKVLGLHQNIQPDDVFFWFSTTGWMMWNYLVSGLLVGSTIVLFDGDPMHPDINTLWQLADDTGCTVFGASAGFLMACDKVELRPAPGRIRNVGSTGAPLAPDGFRWVTEALGPGVLVNSTSGGTDVVSAFVGMVPVREVRAGEIATRFLGVAAAAFDPDGNECPAGVTGELVVTEPMPSMPVALWGDPDGSKLTATYYTRYPGSWHHGDWVTFFDDGACIVSGRSDATLNRGGVRLGTADFYSVVEALPEIADCLVVHLEQDDNPNGRLALFVVAPDVTDDSALVATIAKELRNQLSPRHVPDVIERVAAIPRTLSGKKLEVPVKRVLLGAEPTTVASRDSMVDPDALDVFVEIRNRWSDPG